jgi:hypothetical protein
MKTKVNTKKKVSTKPKSKALKQGAVIGSNLPKRKHYSTKLKEEKAQLLADIYAILDGNFEVATKYKMLRQLQIDTEKAIWFGEAKLPSKKKRVMFEGLMAKIK